MPRGVATLGDAVREFLNGGVWNSDLRFESPEHKQTTLMTICEARIAHHCSECGVAVICTRDVPGPAECGQCGITLKPGRTDCHWCGWQPAANKTA